MRGSRVTSSSGMKFRPAMARTFTLVRVFSHMVIRFGSPTAATSIAPEMMPSLSCAGPPSVAQFTLMSPKPCSLACFSISFWSSMMTNWM
jgi:hypothetical protein